MQKTCSRCADSKPLAAFHLRAASRDGYSAACVDCIRRDKYLSYWTDPAERQRTVDRATANKQARFDADPAYKRAFHLWGSTKKRGTKIPPWVCIADFVPACRAALRKGAEYELDHVIPLSHPLVCGLHVPANLRVVKRTTNRKKSNTFTVI